MNSIINGANYNIVLTNELDKVLTDLSDQLQFSASSELFVLCDENTIKFCYPIISKHLTPEVKVLAIPPGEPSKTLVVCENLYSTLLNSGADRDALLINLGGGVVTDIGGFVASTYKRGIKFLNIPTSLLAMVDASCGGKTGVDLQSFKNIIGTFCNPELVIIDPVFLKSLPDVEWKCGLAEMLKHSLLDNINHYQKLKAICENIEGGKLNANIKNSIIENIEDSINFKNSIVKSDFKEENIRKHLNFGHTIGHAIESVFLLNSGNAFRHGEAVAIGMICEVFISSQVCGFNKTNMNEIVGLLTNIFDVKRITPEQINQILKAVKNDKKNSDGKTNFVLLDDIGSAVLRNDVSDDIIINSIHFYNNS